MFPLCADTRLAELGYRKATAKSYVLVYEIDKDAKAVRVLRIFHGSENYVDKL
jgi:plasmid stabilization system protein ParE